MVRGGAGESRRGFIVIFLFESLDLCFLVMVEVIAVFWLSCDRGFMCGTWPRCLFVFFLHVHLCVVFARAVSSLVHVFSLPCRTGGLTSMATTPGMCRPSCGTRPCGTPTGPWNRFPTQSVLRTCLGTSYLVGIVLIACGQFNAASRCNVFFFLGVVTKDFEVTEEEVSWAKRMRSQNVLS